MWSVFAQQHDYHARNNSFYHIPGDKGHVQVENFDKGLIQDLKHANDTGGVYDENPAND